MEDEYPRWIYPPDGGQGKLIQTPDDYTAGWSDLPSAPLPAMGERIIGQPATHVAPTPALAAPVAPTAEDAPTATRKSKNK